MIKKIGILTIMLFVINFHYAQAAPILIGNAGFEEPILDDGKYSEETPPDWSLIGDLNKNYFVPGILWIKILLVKRQRVSMLDILRFMRPVL